MELRAVSECSIVITAASGLVECFGPAFWPLGFPVASMCNVRCLADTLETGRSKGSGKRSSPLAALVELARPDRPQRAAARVHARGQAPERERVQLREAALCGVTEGRGVAGRRKHVHRTRILHLSNILRAVNTRTGRL